MDITNPIVFQTKNVAFSQAKPWKNLFILSYLSLLPYLHCRLQNKKFILGTIECRKLALKF